MISFNNLPPGCTDADIERAAGSDDGIACWNCTALNPSSAETCADCGVLLDEPNPDPEDVAYDSAVDREMEQP